VAKRLLEKFSLAFDATLVIPDDELWYFSSLFLCIIIMTLFLISFIETFFRFICFVDIPNFVVVIIVIVIDVVASATAVFIFEC
jgi:hypothetical protein